MNISTMTRLAFRATSLGALALTILAASANSSFAQNTTKLATIAAGIPPYFIPEPVVAGGPELMTVHISGAVFLGAGFTGEVDMFEPGPNGQSLSDRILFDNTGTSGTAMITFLSDDGNGNLPLNPATNLPYPLYPLLTVAGLGPEGPLTTSFLMADTLGHPYTLTATMISDDENNPNNVPPGQSDELILTSVLTPEPSTVCLAGLGLAALAGLASRRRRTRRTA
jgi:MYXO-CTERM domain-containing protein